MPEGLIHPNARSIYIGDIDPNNNIDPVTHVRRNILFKLLLWDSVVFSDSQILTDPRIAMMMDGFSEKKMGDHEAWDDINGWHRGFEMLFDEGLVEVAHRTDKFGEPISLSQLWESMRKDTTAEVPFLPPTPAYANFLDKTFHKKREFGTREMADIFKSNLHSGIAKGVLRLRESDDTDRELTAILLQDTVNFRNILKLIKAQAEKGQISAQRYNEIYHYVAGCYHTNIPKVVHCDVSAKFEDLPLHLDLGYETEESIILPDEKKLRPSWVLDPNILDLLPMESFIRVRRSIEPHLHNGILMRQKTGEMQEKELGEFYDVWESYTQTMEIMLKKELSATYRNIDEITSKRYVSSQKRFQSGIVDILCNVAKTSVSALIPGAELLFDIAEFGKMGAESIGNLIMLNSKKEMEYLIQQKREMFDYIEKCMLGAKVVTRYKS